MTERNGSVGGVLSVLLTVFGSGSLAFYTALRTFWWCPQGGCSLVPLESKLRLLGNLLGVSSIFVVGAVVIWYASVPLLFRPWYPKHVAERTYLSSTLQLPGWYVRSMRHWIHWLWGARRVHT